MSPPEIPDMGDPIRRTPKRSSSFAPGEQKISYLIIGNGIAGVTAAEVLRAADPHASIGVIADDPVPVYYRPALKDYLGGHVPTEKLWARPASFYRDANISFLSDRVLGLDGEEHMVLLQSQKWIYYRKLLLANGASPARLRCPGDNLRGVTTLRTVTDYQRILERLGSSGPIRRVVVSGSGTLALETVESLRQRGLEVTHLLRHTMLWSEVLDATASDMVLQEERRAGVELCLEEEIVKIVGQRGEVSSVITNQGRRISCQMVIVAIGIEPNIKPWLAGGVDCGRGVRVDNTLHTNIPDIYAAGDVVETYNSLTNRTRVLGQWYPAIQQARVASYSMLGRSTEVEPFRADRFYNATFLYGLDFASAGLTITPDQPDYQELIADPQPRSYRKVILKNGIPVGLLALGDRKQALALKRALDRRINLLPVADRLFNPTFNLRAWLDEQDEENDQRQALPLQILSLAPIIEDRQEQAPLLEALSPAAGTQLLTVPLQYPRADRRAQENLTLLPAARGVDNTNETTLNISGGFAIGGENIMLDRSAEQVQGMGASPIPTGPAYSEALLVHIVDPALRLHIAEKPLRSDEKSTLSIGRQAGVHLLLDEGSVSRQHAEITYSAGRYLLSDLGSTNGTFVNEQRLDTSRPYVLQPNDILRFGNIVRLKFLLRVLSSPSPTLYQDDRRDTDSLLPAPTSNGTPRRDTTSLLSAPSPYEQYAATVLDAIREADTYLKQPTTGQAALNRDGTLSTPGNTPPVPASIVEQLKKAPALVIIRAGATQIGTSSEVHFLNPGKRTTIGRASDNDIVLTDSTISSHHAEVYLDIDGFHISDLGSKSGTLVNLTQVSTPYLLSHSDRIKLGSTRLFFIDLQAGKELTVKSAGVMIATQEGAAEQTPALPSPIQTALLPMPLPSPVLEQDARTQKTAKNIQTNITSNTITKQKNVLICPRCGIANIPAARFCASCSTVL